MVKHARCQDKLWNAIYHHSEWNITTKMSARQFLATFLLATIITIVSSYPKVFVYKDSLQDPQEEVFTPCKNKNDATLYCFGATNEGGNGTELKGDTIGAKGGCIMRSDCNFLMRIQDVPGSSEILWTGYIGADNGQFEAAFRKDQFNDPKCQPKRGSDSSFAWKSGSFVLGGKGGGALTTTDGQNADSAFIPQNGGRPKKIVDLDSGAKYNKYQWKSGYDPSVGSSSLSLKPKKNVAFAVKVWSSGYDGCVDFGAPVDLFDLEERSIYGVGTRDGVTEESESGSLLWLWILLALLLLLLLLALLIWCCCCRKKKEPVEQQNSTIPESPAGTSTTGSQVPASAAPGSGVQSNKPSSVVAPKSSAKPSGSTVGAAPSGASTSLRSAYTNVPTGQSAVSSNASMRSKMSKIQSSATKSGTGSKVGSKVGSSSKTGSKTALSPASSSSSSKSSTSK